MSKIRFHLTVWAVALMLTIVAGTALHRLDSATASPQVQKSKMVDINEMMKKLDAGILPEENWPAI